jgi:hypothetical protein
VTVNDVIEPSPDSRAYDDAYVRFRALYPALAPTFHTTR